MEEIKPSKTCWFCKNHDKSRVEDLPVIFCNVSKCHFTPAKALNCSSFVLDPNAAIATERLICIGPDWTPQSGLDKVVSFNETSIAAGMRALFDLLTAIEIRLEEIEHRIDRRRTNKERTTNIKAALRRKSTLLRQKLKRKPKVTPTAIATPTPPTAPQETKSEGPVYANTKDTPIFS